MQLKVDFLCRDSILAAPLALDLVLFSDLAQRRPRRHPGVAELLLQEPADAPGLYPEHDLFIQHTKLKEHAALDDGRGQITHLGRESTTPDAAGLQAGSVGPARRFAMR